MQINMRQKVFTWVKRSTPTGLVLDSNIAAVLLF